MSESGKFDKPDALTVAALDAAAAHYMPPTYFRSLTGMAHAIVHEQERDDHPKPSPTARRMLRRAAQGAEK